MSFLIYMISCHGLEVFPNSCKKCTLYSDWVLWGKYAMQLGAVGKGFALQCLPA